VRRELLFDSLYLKIKFRELERGRILTEAIVTSTEAFQVVFRSEADAETLKSQSLTTTTGMESLIELLILANKCRNNPHI